mmetsp:Transcript_42895/g.84613  ORF Transcript_42895/g.84613 Transcript_42895/m.84613 type:complete len:88 (-) Transcript_42895:452-715(-)
MLLVGQGERQPEREGKAVKQRACMYVSLFFVNWRSQFLFFRETRRTKNLCPSSALCLSFHSPSLMVSLHDEKHPSINPYGAIPRQIK